MKKFLKRMSTLLLTIIIIAAIAIGGVYRQSQPYLQEGQDTKIIMMRTAKMLLRDSINNTNNPSLLSILQGSYNAIHNYSIKSQSRTAPTQREQVIQTSNHIIELSINIPGNIILDIHTESLEQGDGIVFSYNEQYLGSLQIYTTSGREQTISGGTLNMEKVSEYSGFVVSYSQGLDNPFTGFALETFSEIASLFNQAITTTTIQNIQDLDYSLGYIQSIQTGDTVTITIDPIQLFTGETAAKAREQHDPEGCAAAISGTNNILCIPENDYYILNSNTGDSMTLTIDEITNIEILNTSADSEMTMIPATVEILQQNITNYQNTPFHVYSSEGILLQLSEQYIP